MAGQATPGFADLDENARELLEKYLAENPGLDARDVLNGAVDFMLEDEEECGFPIADLLVDLARDRRLALEPTGKHHVAFSVWLTEE